MTSGRPPLLTRLESFLGAELQAPAGHEPGRNSFLAAVLESGLLSAAALQRFLAEETGHPTRAPAPELSLEPADGLRDAGVFTIGDTDGSKVEYGVVWPQDIHSLDLLHHRHGDDELISIIQPPHQAPVAGGEDEGGVVQTLLGDLEDTNADVQVVNSHDLIDDVAEFTDEAPIIKLLNIILVQAFKDEASDIHIEAEENSTRVRYRVDGELREVMRPPKRFHGAIVSRVKIMSDLDIAEKRSPQDGRMKLRLGGQSIDVRVSTIPSMYGEKVVMRVLIEGSLQLDLEQLGFTSDQVATYRSLVTRPYGIVLVTGPTGSGKTTTLYSTLRFLNSKAKNIITIEDPVEYQMPNINQIQVNRRAGIDFASGLKSILRQDPDIIMVGEMRDEETAAIAVKAALTGHLVLSTLHTNDAPGAYERLQDMKVAPYLLASAVSGVIAQRLLRLNCSECAQELTVDERELALIGIDSTEAAGLTKQGTGCPHCSGSGYRGRSAIYELLVPSQELKKRILSGSVEDGRGLPGYSPMVCHGRQLVLEGRTSAAEICKVVRTLDVF